MGYHLHHRQQVFPGVHFAEIDLQGLRQSEVDLLMQARLTTYVETPLTLSGLEREWHPTAAQLGMHISTAQMASDALGLGRSGGLLNRLLVPFRLRLRPETLPLRVSFDDEVLRAYVQSVAAEVDRAPVDAALTVQGDRIVSVAPTTGQQLAVEETMQRIKSFSPYPTVRQRVELAIVPVRPLLGDAALQAANELARNILSGAGAPPPRDAHVDYYPGTTAALARISVHRQQRPGSINAGFRQASRGGVYRHHCRAD